MTDFPIASAPAPARGFRWLSLFFGLAVLAAVVIAATHFAEGEAFLRLAREARPSWIIVALAVQAATYWAQGRIWHETALRAGKHLPGSLVYKLSLVKLFVDQALPSAGFSGTIVVAQVLERGPLPHAAIMAGVVVNTTSFFVAYVALLVTAVIILLFSNHASLVIVVTCVLFVVVSLALIAGMMKLSGRNIDQGPRWLFRYRIVRNLWKTMKDADPALVRSARLQGVASVYQALTFVLDGATLWILIHSLGAAASPGLVFASFMVSNLVRTVSFIPGGLGTFEAAVVLMLRQGGVPVATALSTVLLFRGVTFFLPMIPGLWYSQRLIRKAPNSEVTTHLPR